MGIISSYGYHNATKDSKELSTTPGLPAVVKICRKKTGMVLASVGVVIGGVAGWYADWLAALMLFLLFLILAVVTYSGVSHDSKVSIARGYVFVYPEPMSTGGLELWFEAICKPRAVKEEGDAVLVSSRWSQLRIMFENETSKESFIAEVSGLLKPRGLGRVA
jgi:hypothetical protein